MPADHALKVAINGDPLRPESLYASGSCPCGWGYGPTQSEGEVRAEYDRAHPAPAPADPLATALEEIRGRERAATKGPWQVTQGSPGVETAWQLPEGHARAGSPVPVASMVLTVGKAEREAANARFTAGARSDVPRLLAAVEAALALHEIESITVYRHCPAHGDMADPLRFEKMASCPDCGRHKVPGCGHCDEDWPCPTVKAITKALLGEETPDGQ